ncbi:MAG: imidazole glycerol phosphate synthase subunit HisH [Candidatus Ventricola sp.]|nr:imidazole glycerol phosphate synthase subunit HisH [Candidatus Ventricola sp.]
MIAIIDYGVGNLFSLKSSLAMIGAQAVVTGDADVLRSAERLILPGVGAFGDARQKLAQTGLDAALCAEAARGKPVLGICLGMQMLFDRSLEYGEHKGLGLIPGEVVPMAGRLPEGLKIPHIGWNALAIRKPDHPLMKYTESGDCVYFVHSFYASDCADSVIATAEYGIDVTAAVAKGNVMGCQFHPEKSGTVGLGILKAFCEM